MNLPRAIFFDLDATLLDGSGFAVALARTCESIASAGAGLSAARLLQANTEVWNTYWPSVERDWTLGVLTGAAVSREAWRRTLEICGLQDEALVQLACTALNVHAQESLRPFPDVQAVLDTLRPRMSLAVITNGAADVQMDKIHGLGIEPYFDAVVMSGEFGLAKPDPAIFRFALDKLDLSPEEVWHVGDSLASDVAGARAAGIRAVWLNRAARSLGDGDPRPDMEIRSLTELLPLIEGS